MMELNKNRPYTITNNNVMFPWTTINKNVGQAVNGIAIKWNKSVRDSIFPLADAQIIKTNDII